MRRDFSTPQSAQPILARRGVLVLSGYALTATVERGRLCLRDGVARSRRASRFSKATCGIKRLVIHGSSGLISLKALRWLHDIGAAIVNIDSDGEIILAYSPQVEGPTRLRRAQVEASGQGVATEILRHLLQDKVSGQAHMAERLGGASAALTIRECLSAMKEANTESLAFQEAHAASAYWKTWSTVRMTFARRDDRKVPDHWRSFGPRQSSISGSTRNAANPANALLNYVYAILEAETRIALLTVGLDPGLGLLHADQPSRDSLALDAMEPVRPWVDGWLFDLLLRSTFAAADFYEREDGTVRLSRAMAGILSETASLFAKEIAPVAEWITREFSRASGTRSRGSQRVVTPLTQANRSSGRLAYRKPKPAERLAAGMLGPRFSLECGGRMEKGRGKLCSRKCNTAYKEKISLPRFQEAGLDTLVKLREMGVDPSHGGETGRKRGMANARRATERAEWKALGLDLDKEKARFIREIQPRLSGLSIQRILEATGFSLYYSSLVRRGKYVPHPVHYPALESLLAS